MRDGFDMKLVDNKMRKIMSSIPLLGFSLSDWSVIINNEIIYNRKCLEKEIDLFCNVVAERYEEKQKSSNGDENYARVNSIVQIIVVIKIKRILSSLIWFHAEFTDTYASNFSFFADELNTH